MMTIEEYHSIIYKLGRSGKQKGSNGYIRILKPDHPFANHRGYVLEHRLIMEYHIGRYLTDAEVVHHKNGIRHDNRIENLELFSTNTEHLRRTKRYKEEHTRDIICLLCRSDKTFIYKNKPIWYKFKDGHMCIVCYRKKRRGEICLISSFLHSIE